MAPKVSVPVPTVVRVTDAGARFAEDCRRILADIEEAETVATDTHAAPRGTLALAVVVAKDVDRIILSQPTMKLVKKLPALRFGDLRIRCAFAEWPIRVE